MCLAIALVIALVGVLAACAQTVEQTATHATKRPAKHPAERPSTHPSAVARASPPALRALDAMAVKGRAPMTGYDRDLFGPAWSDDNDEQGGHNGCDTRNDVLRRDLTQVVLKPGTNGCVVLSGVLRDPYGGSLIHFVRGVGTSEAAEIDHVVALGDAWQTGAQHWSAQRRKDFANDPLELLAVDGPLNMAKGDGDAATWLPPYKPERCAYVARQVAVKKKWGLWVTAAEKAAMSRILVGSCPRQALPGTRGHDASPTP